LFRKKTLSEACTRRSHNNNYITHEQQLQQQRSPKLLPLKSTQAQKTKSFDYAEMYQQLPVLEHDTKRRKVTFQDGSNLRPRSELASSLLSSPEKSSYVPSYVCDKMSSKILHLECEIKQMQLEMLKRFKEVQAVIEQQNQQIKELKKQNKDLKGFLKRKRDY
jgi:hypothetical protein